MGYNLLFILLPFKMCKEYKYFDSTQRNVTSLYLMWLNIPCYTCKMLSCHSAGRGHLTIASNYFYTSCQMIDKIVPKSTVRLFFFVTTSLYVILLDVDSKQRSFTFRKQLICKKISKLKSWLSKTFASCNCNLFFHLIQKWNWKGKKLFSFNAFKQKNRGKMRVYECVCVRVSECVFAAHEER